MEEYEPQYLDTAKSWYNVKLPLKQCSLKELATFALGREELDTVYQEAQALLDEEVTRHHGGYDRTNWYSQQFSKRGTVGDRIASAAVNLSGDEFMFHLDSFAFLFDTARNDSHNFDSALKALNAIWPKLLPARPLKKFAAQYFATLPPVEGDEEQQANRRKVLLYWYLEDTLKRTYGQFLNIAENSLKDKLTARREAWLDVLGKLLIAVAEVRHVTISMVVDKMGDPMARIAHKAYHLLLGMLSETSTNQGILLNEVEKFVFQKNCPLQMQKYCINIINQLVFNRDERKLALKSVQLFLSLFKSLAVSGSIDSSITDALIVGIRRAFPFTGTDFSVLDPHIDAIFVIANKGANFLQRVSAVMLVYQLLSKGYTKLEDRYYRAVYHLLLVGPKQLPHSSLLTGFFALLYKTIRNDKSPGRVSAFVHRLLQRCMFANEAFICASLLLVAEAVNCHNCVRMLIRPAGQQQHKAAAESNSTTEDYDPKARDPRYSHVGGQCVWILNTLAQHSHPSVVKLAVLLREGCDISFDTHPLDDLTITNFLEMFVDAKPTDSSSPADVHGNKLVSANTKGVAVFRRAVHVANIPRVSDTTFAELDPSTVDVNALFLHRFAFQRERFLEGRYRRPGSFWSGESEETDQEIAGRLADSKNAFLAPDSSQKKKAKNAEKEKQQKKKKAKSAGEEAASDDDDDAYFDPTAFDHDFNEDAGDDDEDSFDWGDGSEGYGDSDEGSDGEEVFSSLAQRAERVTGKKNRRVADDPQEEEDEDDGVLAKKKKGGAKSHPGELDASEFDSMMAEHQTHPSKKQRREEEWLNKATASSGRASSGGSSRFKRGTGGNQQRR